MLQFARGVQGIDVHHNHAGAQDPKQRDRVLQKIGHHQGDAGCLRQAHAFQPGGEVAAQAVEFGIGDGGAGMIVVNINPLYTARELEHQLKDSGAEVIVILENFAHVLETVLANTAVEHVVSTQVGDLLTPHRRLLVNFAVKHMKKMVPEWHIGGAIEFRTELGPLARARLDEAAPSHADIAFLQYTGGTTGRSKGAMLTHGGLVANMLQARAWSRGFLEEGSEIVVTALPMYHVFSLTTNCLLFIKLGGLNLLITNPRDMPGFVKELNTTPWTVMTGVNTLFNGLLNTPGFEALDFSRLKFALGGGAAVHRTVAERWQAVTRRPIFQGYGLTETSPFVTCSPLDGEYSGSIGLPLPSTEIAIMDDENRELPPGAEGEICVKGPQVMAGYWQFRSGILRFHWATATLHRNRHHGRRKSRTAARRRGRDLRQGSAGDGGLLAVARRNRGRIHARRMAPHRRHRHHGRGRLHADHGPQEGHDSGFRLQRLPE